MAESDPPPSSLLVTLFQPVGLFFSSSSSSVFFSPASSKRKDSEPGTKSLLSNAEMMAHHPTDPVEMRRINFQTPGTKAAAHAVAPALITTHLWLLIMGG